MLRGKPTQFSGMQRVVENFLTGLRRKGVDYSFNKHSMTKSRPDKIISFGLGRKGVEGIARGTPVIAAVGFPRPREFPELCEQYNVRKFLYHSNWILDYARSDGVYPDEVFALWHAGIDTDEWIPAPLGTRKDIDVLIYNKIRFDKDARNRDLLAPIKAALRDRELTVDEIRYPGYLIGEYREKVTRAKSMVFVCEHETQGLAYQECLSSGVPIIAWDQGYYLDPNQTDGASRAVPASSVPFFDRRCGATFVDAGDFTSKFDTFFESVLRGQFRPREFILENLTIATSTDRMLSIYNSL
jgi:glycosyltransferase involved in cell wall biosynthesis